MEKPKKIWPILVNIRKQKPQQEKQKKKEDLKKFIRSLNKNVSIKYVWNKMRVLKNRFDTISWNKWQGKNRENEINKTIEKLSPPWAPEKNIETENEIEKIDQEIQHMNKEIMLGAQEIRPIISISRTLYSQ